MSLLRWNKDLRVATQISQDIWNIIVSDLSLSVTRHAVCIFEFKLLSEFQRYHAVWEAIFKDETWISQISVELKLNSVLIDSNLESLYDNRKREYKETRYFVLTVNAKDAKTFQTLHRSKDLFESCLQSYNVFNHDQDNDMFVTTSQEYNLISDIRLNVDEIFNVSQCDSDWSSDLIHDSEALETEIIKVNAQRFFINRERLVYLFWQNRRKATRITERANLNECYSRKDLSNDFEYVVLLYLKSSEDDRKTYEFISRKRRFHRSNNYEMWEWTVVKWLRENLHSE